MTEKERITRILQILDEEYPQDKCYLEYTTAWQLLFATILSAQCTDARVNIVTKELYKKYPDIKAFAAADIAELENDIRSTGFFRNKARNIKACAGELLVKYNGEVPKDIELLTKLPGVGRKTANVIRSHIYHEPSIVVDTHVKRLSKRLGITDTEDPVKAEFELMEKLPREHWINYNLQLMAHGRAVCTSQRPSCETCRLRTLCPYK